MSQEKTAKLFAILLIVAFLLSLGMNVLTKGKVFDVLLFNDTIDSGMDFYNSVLYTRGRVPYTQYGTIYPPLANVFFTIIMYAVPHQISDAWANSYEAAVAMRLTEKDLRLQQDLAFPFMLYTMLSFVILYQLCAHCKEGSKTTKWLFALAMIITLGTLQALERGNILTLAFCLLLFFVHFKDSKSKFLGEMALIALGLSAGLKLYPALFGLLLLLDKQYMKAVRSVFYGAFFFFVPFFLFEGVDAIKIYFDLLINFSNLAQESFSLSISQNITTVLQILKINETSPTLYISLIQIISNLSYVLMGVGLVLCFLAKSRWKVLTVLSLLTILVPSKMAMYNLIFMIIPIIAFFNANEGKSRLRWIYFSFFLLLSAFFPYSFQRVMGRPFVQLVIQCTLVLLLILVSADIVYKAITRRRTAHTLVAE